ncbi:cardiolipin synthase [Bacillus mesophilus]|uniref:Cardiolipin synthase n=1 Tax=Bacillus mesophilus TaxID=1808955 RepID=A0A6M0QB26_9BACI|nr:cardiolipin synthase [Bacillus mesophilus]MBM7662424.1 cardiolipin synthase [Bacillus mesophilus]NEY72949.1 cardiolipin synthase [Bacillus mesophilus]
MELVLLVLFIIFLWMAFDYRLGRISHIKKVNMQEYPLRKSDISLFITGQSLYKDLFHHIEHATNHIHVLFYIVKDDEISKEFLQLLMKKAQDGVEVRLLLDRIGSKDITKKMQKDLKENGVLFSFCHVPKLPYLFYSINERNHRKISVIDGRIGYLGGFNIGKEYIGLNPKLGDWRDYHLRIEGEGVQDLQKQFIYDWEDATKYTIPSNSTYYPTPHQGEITHKVVPTNAVFLEKVFIELIKNAKKEIIIGTPYFIPSAPLFEELIHAAKKGIDVKVIVPIIGDHPLVKEAAFPYFKPLLDAGCKVYRYNSGFFHAKVIVIDEQVCDIGTANFDKRSLYLNHEINCLIYNQPFIRKVRSLLLQDIQTSEEVTPELLANRSFLQRGKEAFSTLVSGFL